jgi:hypothetical protein
MPKPFYSFNSLNGLGFSNQLEITEPVRFWPIVQGTGNVSVTIDILCSPDGDLNKEKSILTSPLTISGTTVAEDYSSLCTVAGFYRYRVTAIGGTGAIAGMTARG